MSLRVITNNYLDMQIWDLDPSEARGPFIVVQSGFAPGDDTAKDKFFVLRRDGRWIDISHYLVSDRPEVMDDAVFESTADAMDLLRSLPSRPEVVKTDVPDEDLMRWYHAHPEVRPGLPGLRQWVAGYRGRKRATAGR